MGFLRVDTLSLLISMANVTSNSDVLVVDMLTGAVAERLGGSGYVCNAYMGSTPYPLDIVRIFNFSIEICRRFFHQEHIHACRLSAFGGYILNGTRICGGEIQPQ